MGFRDPAGGEGALAHPARLAALAPRERLARREHGDRQERKGSLARLGLGQEGFVAPADLRVLPARKAREDHRGCKGLPAFLGSPKPPIVSAPLPARFSGH